MSQFTPEGFSDPVFAAAFKDLLLNVAISAKRGHIADPENLYAPFMREISRHPEFPDNLTKGAA